MACDPDWLTRRADGVRLSVKVAAPAEGAKANAATVKLLAGHGGVAASALSLVSGAGGRRKIVDVQGDTGSLMQRLQDLAAKA